MSDPNLPYSPRPLTGWKLRRTEIGWRIAELQRSIVTRLPEKLRWRIITIVDRRPDQCWSGLVDWLYSNDPGYAWKPSSPIDDVCRRDLANCGACYCGKLRVNQP